jgi:hypothetical protein
MGCTVLPAGDGRWPLTSTEEYRNPNAKLTSQQVGEIREKYEAGKTKAELALEYGVSEPNIQLIVSGKTWKDAGGPIRKPGTKPEGFGAPRPRLPISSNELRREIRRDLVLRIADDLDYLIQLFVQEGKHELAEQHSNMLANLHRYNHTVFREGDRRKT